MSYYLIEGGFSTDAYTFIDAGIGTWDAVRRIAVLTTDISQTIKIIIDNVILKGLKPDNTAPIISNPGSDGINISLRQNITISNLEIMRSNNGIYCDGVKNVIITGNSIHDNATGIKFSSNNNSNKIEKNTIFNNTIGIDFNINNSTNIIENNCIYDNYEYGISFFENNNSNIIKGNKITNDSHGIYLALFNNSNSILCNDISFNKSSNTGIYIDGDNNSIKQNNLVNNCTHAISNGNNNIFDGNYWYPWDGCIPYSHCGVVDCNPCCYPIECGKRPFKQFATEVCLTIPKQKPCAEEILSSLAEVQIAHVNVVKTPRVCSQEGQTLTGCKAVIIGNLIIKLEYISDDPAQSVHAAHFTCPFSTYIVLDKNHAKGTKFEIQSLVEDIFIKLLDKRNISCNASLYLEVK